MRLKLFFMISYGAMLLLLMPVTVMGTAAGAGLFCLGTILVLQNRVSIAKERRYLLIPVAGFFSVCLGVLFYQRWLMVPKMQVVAGMVHILLETLLLWPSTALAAVSVYCIYAVLCLTTGKLEGVLARRPFLGDLILSILAAVATVCLTQTMMATNVLSMGVLNFAMGVLIVATGILLLYCLFGRIPGAVFAGSGIFVVIATINAYVHKFRGRLFEPVDVFSMGTAMQVADSYSLLPIPAEVLTGWGFFAAMIAVLYCLRARDRGHLTLKKRMGLLAVCVCGCLAVSSYTSQLKTFHWNKEGVQFNGCVLDFVSKFKEISGSKPDNYSPEEIGQLASRYRTENTGAEGKRPHIIVIMSEAYSDLTVVGDYATNQEVAPFISSLKDNAVTGYALASVYGGNTANSEYEFLTGNSMAWMSPNAVPYNQYMRGPKYSLVSYLKSNFGYKAIAMHPFWSVGWNRPAAYAYLGFDECHFLEAFPQQDYIRDFISDREMYDYLIETYEAQKEEPLFVFGITMQNHGGYLYQGDNYTKHISLADHADRFPEVEQYLSLLHETDKATQRLVSYFENVEEDVIIVFFGDHQPCLEEEFYETFGTPGNSMDAQQSRYKVPFFVWANYDIEEGDVGTTSLNYLSGYVLDAAGIPLSPYNRFLRDMEQMIPAINAHGFYSLERGTYVNFSEASETEHTWLEQYEALQYNSTFDRANRNAVMFPLPEE